MTIILHPRGDKKWPYVDKCEQPYCYWYVAQKTTETKPHPCPWTGGPTKIAWFDVTKTLVEQAWDLLDSHMDELLLAQQQEPVDEFLVASLKGKCRGVAEVLGMFMVPYFRNANDVAAEAKRRADARARKDAEYETAGLKSLRYQPPPDSPSKYKSGAAMPSIGDRSKHNLSDADIQGIKNAAQFFSKEDLAKTYKVTVRIIDEILAQKASEPVDTPA
jgi:hypothetical protein